MGFQVTWPSLPGLSGDSYFSQCFNVLGKTLRAGIDLCYQSTFSPIASLLTSTLAKWVQDACCEYSWYQIMQQRMAHFLNTAASRALPWVPEPCRPRVLSSLKPQTFPQTVGAVLGLWISFSLGWEAFLSGVLFYACLTKVSEHGYRRQIDSDGRLSQAMFQGMDPMLLPRLMSLAIGIIKALYSRSFLPLLIYAGGVTGSIIVLKHTRNILEPPVIGSRMFERRPIDPDEQNNKRTILFMASIQSQFLSERMTQFVLYALMRYFSGNSGFEETLLSEPLSIAPEPVQIPRSQSCTWVSFFNREGENICPIHEMVEFRKMSTP